MAKKANENVDSQNDNEQDLDNPGENGGAPSADEDDNAGGQFDQVDDGNDTDDPNELREKLKAANQRNQDLADARDKQFVRAKHAEGWIEKKDASGNIVRDEKGKPVWVKKEARPNAAPAREEKKQDDLNSRDVLALTRSGITDEEDIDQVVDYSKLRKITVAEALQDNVVKTILSENKKKRDTANATNTGATRRGQAGQSADSILEKASETGEIPENPTDLAKLTEERLARKGKK